jgi:fucose permease
MIKPGLFYEWMRQLKQFRMAFFFALWTMVIYGAIDATRSATGPLLQAQTHITYTQLGALFAANSIGYLLGSLPGGFALHHVGLKRIILCGSIGLGAILAVLPIWHIYLLLWLGFFVLGWMMGWLEIGINAVIPAVSTSSRAESTGFNLLHGCYGVGATVVPIVVIWLATASGSWGTPFYGIGLLTLLAALAIARFRFPKAPEPMRQPEQHAAQTRLFTSPLLYTLLIAITLYVVAETGTAAWLPTYLVHAQGQSVNQSSWFLTGFYLVFTIGRLSGPVWVHHLGPYGSIVFSSVFSLVLFSIALISPSMPVLFIISGFGFAVTFPMIVHIASQAFAQETGRVLGVLFTSAGVGSMAMSWLIGILATRCSIQTAFWLIPVSLVLVLFATVAAKWLDQKRTQSVSTTVPPASL